MSPRSKKEYLEALFPRYKKTRSKEQKTEILNELNTWKLSSHGIKRPGPKNKKLKFSMNSVKSAATTANMPSGSWVNSGAL